MEYQNYIRAQNAAKIDAILKIMNTIVPGEDCGISERRRETLRQLLIEAEVKIIQSCKIDR